MTVQIFQPLKLASGLVLQNRIAKAAMSENMADPGNLPGERIFNAYETWGLSGAGLLITGHVMVDRHHISEPHNIVLDPQVRDLAPFQTWARRAKKEKSALWMQINHPGKQIPKFVNPQPVAPSALPFPAPMNKLFNTPRELTSAEILKIIASFAVTAKLAQSAGFDGVQIHAAHGYLISQFLSPRHNQRQDRWGGSAENRMNFLIEIYHAIRNEVGRNFGVAIKINSADFMRGGFSETESLAVLKRLDQLAVDFIEISGGTYEAPIMMSGKQSTMEREAYFKKFTHVVKEVVQTPIMLTGGLRTLAGMESALANHDADLLGLARPFAVDPDLPKRLGSDPSFVLEITPKKTGIPMIDALVPFDILWYTQQIQRMGQKKWPKKNRSVWATLFQVVREMLNFKR